MTIARFGKPLFANMHHRVHAVAGALRKPNVACPHPDVSMISLFDHHSNKDMREHQRTRKDMQGHGRKVLF